MTRMTVHANQIEDERIARLARHANSQAASRIRIYVDGLRDLLRSEPLLGADVRDEVQMLANMLEDEVMVCEKRAKPV